MDPQQIDRIVRDVVRQLRTGEAESPLDSHEAGVLRCADRVVTTARLAGNLEGVCRLQVGTRAVVTPAARDLLTEQGVRLVRTDEENSSSPESCPVPLVVGLAETRCDGAGLLKALAAKGIDCRSLSRARLPLAVADLVREVARGERLGLLLTDRPRAAACLANRRAGIRAGVAGTADEVAALRKELGMNLLAVDPDACGQAVLQQIAVAFCRGGLPPCPDELRESAG